LDGSRDRVELARAMGSSGEVLGVALRVLETHGMFTE
jgi:hypothetical protein